MWKNCYVTVALHSFTWKANIYFAWPILAVVYHCADTFRVPHLFLSLYIAVMLDSVLEIHSPSDMNTVDQSVRARAATRCVHKKMIEHSSSPTSNS
jgi:hypothetical protein